MTASDWAWRADSRERSQPRVLELRVSRQQMARFHAAAAAAKLTVEEWARGALVREAIRMQGRGAVATSEAQRSAAPDCPECKQPLPRCECEET